MRNRNGDPYFLSNDFDILNPAYFDHLDSIVRMANDSGLAVTLVPLWAAFSYLYASSGERCFTRDQCMRIARYIGARYAGFNVFWIVGGDNSYDTPERKAFWSEFARTLRDAGGWRHLTTLHPHGWATSFQYFDNETEWLDINMYQSSHLPNITFTYDAALQGYALTPVKPVLNGEAAYEDIPSKMWAPGDTSEPTSVRITDADVRQASYESVLSGAIVGMVYGANGIWQWHYVENDRASHDPRYLVDTAMAFPGSTQMGVFKRLMERFAWWKLSPRRAYVLATDRDMFLPLAASDERVVAYFRRRLAWARLDPGALRGSVRLTWIDPVTGAARDSSTIAVFGPEMLVAPPDTNDWVLCIERGDAGSASSPPTESCARLGAVPNPFRGDVLLHVGACEPGAGSVRVYTLDGRRLVQTYSSGVVGDWVVPLAGLPAGAYMAVATTRAASGAETSSSVILVSLGP